MIFSVPTFCRKKQHFGRKYKLVLLRTMYGTPLSDLDSLGHWATGVKEQHYAQYPARDAIANLLGFTSANIYWIPRDDLNPAEMDEFKGMVNKVLPWLGRAAAQVTEVRQCTLLTLRRRAKLRPHKEFDTDMF